MTFFIEKDVQNIQNKSQQWASLNLSNKDNRYGSWFNQGKNTSIKNNCGFTIIEIMIVIIIIAIAMSLSIYSINIIFGANAESYANQFKTDLRFIKDQNMAASIGTYSIMWHDNGTDIYYDMLKDSVSQKTVKIHKSVEVTYNGGNINGITILFDTSDGTVIDDALGNNGAGIYRFVNNASDTHKTVTLIEETGRID